MQSKRCSKCGVVKPVSGFNKKLAARDGLQSICRECSNAHHRAYREAHREEIRAYDRAYRRAYREAHREEKLAYDRAYREAHREKCNANHRAYREAHREERRAHQRAYREAHREECDARIRKRQIEHRDASREVATRNGEPWTPAEDHVVLTSEGTMLEIAIELGRTTDSVHGRRKRLRRKAVTA